MYVTLPVQISAPPAVSTNADRSLSGSATDQLYFVVSPEMGRRFTVNVALPGLSTTGIGGISAVTSAKCPAQSSTRLFKGKSAGRRVATLSYIEVRQEVRIPSGSVVRTEYFVLSNWPTNRR